VSAAPQASARRREPLSIKQRLLLWLVLPLLVTAPSGGLVLYTLVHDATAKWLDQGLGDTVQAIGNYIRTHDGEVIFEVSQQTDRALRFDRLDRIYYVVLAPGGQVVAGDAQLADYRFTLRPGEWRVQDDVVGVEPVRLISLGVACGAPGNVCQVRVAETIYKRTQLRRELLLGVSGVMFVLAALIVLAGWIAIRQGLRPIAAISDELERRDLDRLEPIGAWVPVEMAPLREAFNRLFERLQRAARSQQDFISNAAHQLRTPLTSLRTDIELALLEPHDPGLEPLLQRLKSGVERSARLAQQMLSLARSEAAQLHIEPPRRVDLRELVAQSAEDWVPRALRAGIDLGFELAPAAVTGQQFLLHELVENLVHNALAYAGEGAGVTVRTRSDARHAVVEVEDTGPGIPAAERDRMFERFQRGAQPQGSGSGLGLAIARDIARQHGGELGMHDGVHGRGLMVRLTLPLAA